VCTLLASGDPKGKGEDSFGCWCCSAFLTAGGVFHPCFALMEGMDERGELLMCMDDAGSEEEEMKDRRELTSEES